MRPPPPLRNLSEGEKAAIDTDCRSVKEGCYRGLFTYPQRAIGTRLLIFLDDIDHKCSKLSQACNATHRLGNPRLNLHGVCNKLPKVHSHPFKGVSIPGLQSKLRFNETFLMKRKAFKSK